MPYDPEKRHRRSIRLRGYDYAQAGAYFVTVCTHGRQPYFGTVTNGTMHLNACGRVVEEEWQRTAQLRPYVRLGAHVVMPNHFHGIIWIADREPSDANQDVSRSATVARSEGFGKPVPGSLPTIVRAFKGAVTKRIHAIPQAAEGPVWQRNYHEHVIRDDADLARIRQYVADNPARWHEDRYYDP